jgi:hypothetical protein
METYLDNVLPLFALVGVNTFEPAGEPVVAAIDAEIPPEFGSAMGLQRPAERRWKQPMGSFPATVSRYFDEHDKVRFVEDWCTQNGFSMSQVAAIGDSRSEVPLFRRAGTSIALNATPDAREAATHTLDTDDLCDVLALLQAASDDRTAE